MNHPFNFQPATNSDLLGPIPDPLPPSCLARVLASACGLPDSSSALMKVINPHRQINLKSKSKAGRSKPKTENLNAAFFAS